MRRWLYTERGSKRGREGDVVNGKGSYSAVECGVDCVSGTCNMQQPPFLICLSKLMRRCSLLLLLLCAVVCVHWAGLFPLPLLPLLNLLLSLSLLVFVVVVAVAFVDIFSFSHSM